MNCPVEMNWIPSAGALTCQIACRVSTNERFYRPVSESERIRQPERVRKPALVRQPVGPPIGKRIALFFSVIFQVLR